ncbi:MAG: co-chaperone GroES [Candidatus Peribacteraceae bacterium]|nr:co-chaperone GroES [Candidatus Peribacteraceae bacterium]
MTIKMLDDKVLVRPAEVASVTAGGIELPQSVLDEKQQKGIVVATGPGKMGKHGKRIPLEVEEGDYILYGKFTGQKLDVDGVEHYWMDGRDDVLAVVG